MVQPKRYVVAGAGRRAAYMFVKPLSTDYRDTARLVGLFDVSEASLAKARKAAGDESLPSFTDWDAMMQALDPDAVVIASPDNTHAEYMVKTLKAGKRAITEKPLCTSVAQVRAIQEALQTPGCSGFVAHNNRYSRDIWMLKDLVQQGRIGKLISMNFQEMLDWRHGAYYFRRWHRHRVNTGGLLIHKACHHFDFLNWIAGSKPVTLSATGGLAFYGSKGPFRHDRCPGCPHAAKCDFYFDSQDGAIADLCVFDESIDIEDHASAIYTYDNGIQVTYSLSTFSPYEGVHFVLEGTKGRLELVEFVDTQWTPGTAGVPGIDKYYGATVTEYLPGKGVQKISVPHSDEAHGGGDLAIRKDLFTTAWNQPPPAALATVAEGTQAVLLGFAACQSIAEGGRLIQVQDLLSA